MTQELPALELDKKNRRRVSECPCGKSNKDGKFIPYVGHEASGYCHACGESFFPSLESGQALLPARSTPQRIPVSVPSIHGVEVVESSLKRYARNHFAQFIESLFAPRLAMALLHRYRIGTAKGGRTVFWQLDNQGRARAGKIILYDPITGKRSKVENPNWVHSVMNLEGFHLKQCPFGSHMLSSVPKETPIAIVEAEKTALIASAYLPGFLWLATGGSNGTSLTSAETLALLKGRSVVLFPDTGAYTKWSEKATQMRAMGIRARVSDLLENKGRPDNWDMADELLSYRQPLILEDGRVLNWALTEPEGYPLFWDHE